MDYLRQQGEIAEPEVPDIDLYDEDTPEAYRLAIRKKRQAQLIKQMMQDAGYDDLARMTTIKKEKMNFSDEDF